MGLGMHAICGDSPERLHLARPSFPVLLARFHGYQCWTVLEDAEEHAPGWVGTDPELASCGLCRFTGCEAHSTPTPGKKSHFFLQKNSEVSPGPGPGSKPRAESQQRSPQHTVGAGEPLPRAVPLQQWGVSVKDRSCLGWGRC